MNAVALQPPLESVFIMSKTSILQTATVELHQSGSVTLCVCLFDTGAQKTCIMNSVPESLGCPTVRTKKPCIEGFNCSVPESVYPVYELTAVGLSSQTTFHAVGTDKLPIKVSMPGRNQAIHDLTVTGASLVKYSYGDSIPFLV